MKTEAATETPTHPGSGGEIEEVEVKNFFKSNKQLMETKKS